MWRATDLSSGNMATVSPAKPSAIHASRRTKRGWGPCKVSGVGGTICCAETVVALTSTSAAILRSDMRGDLAFNVGPGERVVRTTRARHGPPHGASEVQHLRQTAGSRAIARLHQDYISNTLERVP